MQQYYMFFETNPGSNTPQNSTCLTTFLANYQNKTYRVDRPARSDSTGIVRTTQVLPRERSMRDDW